MPPAGPRVRFFCNVIERSARRLKGRRAFFWQKKAFSFPTDYDTIRKNGGKAPRKSMVIA